MVWATKTRRVFKFKLVTVDDGLRVMRIKQSFDRVWHRLQSFLFTTCQTNFKLKKKLELSSCHRFKENRDCALVSQSTVLLPTQHFMVAQRNVSLSFVQQISNILPFHPVFL